MTHVKIKCKHWNPCNVRSGGCCSTKQYERPSFGVCLLSCDFNTNPPTEKEKKKFTGSKKKSKGLGDTVKKVIDKVTFRKVKSCGGCKKRQEALNKLLPYKGNKHGN